MSIGGVSSFRGDVGELQAGTCECEICVDTALREVPSYHPGRFDQSLVSPDGEWVAFTAWAFDRPKDLLILPHP